MEIQIKNINVYFFKDELPIESIGSPQSPPPQDDLAAPHVYSSPTTPTITRVPSQVGIIIIFRIV